MKLLDLVIKVKDWFLGKLHIEW